MVAMEVDDDAFKRPAPPKEKSKEKTSFTIFEIFNFAQKEETDLVKVVKKMAEIYKSTPFDKFTSDLRKCLQFVLCAQEKCKQVDKCLTFVIKFVMNIVSADQMKKHQEKKDKSNNESKEGNEEEEEDEDDDPNHPLLRNILFFLFETMLRKGEKYSNNRLLRVYYYDEMNTGGVLYHLTVELEF
ncbi:hypothetical protein M8J77_018022 [Diaphorina citri]|nr:hypothetical protein M8J77_018022 [Diaphorina citri]